MNLNKGAVNVAVVVAVVALVVAVVAVVRPAVVERVVEKASLGAVSTLDGVDNPYVSINGVKTHYSRTSLIATSTVACSFANPFGATSTLISWSADIRTNSLGAAQAGYLSTSTTNAATGSPALLAGVDIAVDGPDSVAWASGNATSTGDSNNGLLAESSSGDNMYVLAPGEFLNFSIASTTPGTFSAGLTGTCKAIFQEL